mmetsp:Transcript_20789/g.38635  ORF Transcript_20789/g.38635 Transcript_20789/m.38635 type:complete len:234 (+) Transcript_20789:30-731(+)
MPDQLKCRYCSKLLCSSSFIFNFHVHHLSVNCQECYEKKLAIQTNEAKGKLASKDKEIAQLKVEATRQLQTVQQSSAEVNALKQQLEELIAKVQEIHGEHLKQMEAEKQFLNRYEITVLKKIHEAALLHPEILGELLGEEVLPSFNFSIKRAVNEPIASLTKMMQQKLDESVGHDHELIGVIHTQIKQLREMMKRSRLTDEAIEQAVIPHKATLESIEQNIKQRQTLIGEIIA